LSSENVKIDTFPALLMEPVFGDLDGDESGGVLQPVNKVRITSKYK
jgi:hypothetical protein